MFTHKLFLLVAAAAGAAYLSQPVSAPAEPQPLQIAATPRGVVIQDETFIPAHYDEETGILSFDP